MGKKLEAVYENGVLRLPVVSLSNPLEPLDLREHQRVTIIVSKVPVTPSDEGWLDDAQLFLT